MPWKCSIPQCQSSGRVTMMHGCPRRKPEILKQWLKVLGKEHLFGDPKVHRILICDHHFSEKQKFPASRRNRTNLKYDAVPDQNLPNENLSNSQSMSTSSSNDSFMNFVDVSSTGLAANKMSRLNTLTDCDQSMNDRSWVEICDEELEAEIKQELESDEESDPLRDVKSEPKHESVPIKQEDAIEEPVKQEHLDDDGFVSTAALKNILSYADVLSQGKKSEDGKNKRKIVTNIPTDELSLTSHLDIFHVDSPCKEVKKEETEIDIMLDEDTVMFSPVKKEENLAKNMKRPFKLLDSPVQDRRKRTDSVHSTHKVAKSNKHSDVHSSKHNTDKNSSSPSSKRELEVNPDILSRRQKQIDYGKNTVGYERYRQMVPRNERTKEHPKTPPKHLKMSRRAWDGLVKNWRLKLHKWDPSGDNDDFELESVSSEQYSLSSEVCSSYDSSSVKSDSTPSTPTQSSSRKMEDGGGMWTRNTDHKTDKSKELWPNCPQKSDKSDDEEYLECESLNENCVEACS